MRAEKIAGALFLVIFAANVHAASPAARAGGDSNIYVTSVAGEVAVTMAGNSATVEPKSTVALPARIVTGEDGTLGLTQAGTNISVAGDSDVEIPAEAVDGNLVARLVQHRGNVFYDVAKRDVGKLRVETPLLVAVIKGTQFNVAVDESGTTISLFEGHLQILSPGTDDIVELDAGEIAIRTLLDDVIRVVGMDDVRLPTPAPQPVAAAGAEDTRTAPQETTVATTVAAREDTSAKPADEARAVAVDTTVKDATVIKPKESVAVDVREQVVVAAVDTRVDIGIVSVDAVDTKLDSRGHGHGHDLDVALDATPAVLGGKADLDVVDSVDLGRGVDLGTTVDLVADVDLGTVDLGATVDLDTTVDVDTTLDLAPALDLGTVTDVGATIDLGDTLPAPTPARPLIGLPTRP